VFSSQHVPVATHTVPYTGRVMRPFSGKTTAEMHATTTSAPASSPHHWRNAPSGYTSLGFPGPRRLVR